MSPYIAEGTFGARDLEEPLLLRMGVTIDAETIIALLYHAPEVDRELAAAGDDRTWQLAAIEIAARGTAEAWGLAQGIRADEDHATLTSPGRLARCRRRIADLIGPAWLTAPYRCPCGYATASPDDFTSHLNPGRRIGPGHHLTDAARTLAQLWQADARPGDGTRPETHPAEPPEPADDAAMP
jgi:hypothetical protein